MEEVLKFGRRASYKKGEIVLRPSDIGGSVFYVKSGMLHAYTIEHNGDKNIVTVYGAADFFPLSYLIKKKPLAVYYEAITDCEIIRFQEADLKNLMKTNVEACYAMLEQVTKQFVVYKAVVDNFGYKFARERVAYRLLLLARLYGEKTDGNIIMQRFSQDSIGNATNLSRESVSREISRFERLGFISYDQHKMNILNEYGLRKEIAPDASPLFIDDL